MAVVEHTHSQDIAASLRTRHVQTPLERVASYPSSAAVAHIKEDLTRRGFDYAPVIDEGVIRGYLYCADLESSDGDLDACLQPLTSRDLIAADAPVATLLRALKHRDFLLVIDGAGISGIVTPADLNKQAGRAYFYLHIAALELTMAERIRGHFPDQEEAMHRISEKRRAGIRQRFNEAVSDDVAADLVAMMDFADLHTMVKKTAELRASFGDYTNSSWNREVSGPLTKLRHDVMHTVRTMSTNRPDSLQRLIDLDILLHALLNPKGT